MKIVDLDALSPEPVKVKFQGRTYEVRRDVPTARAVELMRLLLKVNILSQRAAESDDPAVVDELLEATGRVPVEAAKLMTDDPGEQEKLAAELSLEAAKEIIGLVIERGKDTDESPQKAAKKAKK